MRSTTLILILFLATSKLCTAQVETAERHEYKFKREVSIDATAVIGNLLSLNSERARSPYGFGFRWHFDNYSIRFNGNTFYDKKTISDFSNGVFIERDLEEQEHSIRVAFEKGIDVANKFRLLYSADILLGYKKSSSSTNISFNRVDQDLIVGLGPSLRIEYRISDRFMLTTESTLYGNFIFSEDRFKLDQNPESIAQNVDYNIMLALPTALTFSVGF